MKACTLPLLGLALGAALLTPRPAEACEPCPSTLDLDASLAQADAIVLARLPDGRLPEYADMPETIELQVDEVLHGPLQPGPIQVHAYSGMCAYGFTPRTASPHLLVMRKGGERWTPVDQGCSTHTLEIVDGKLPASVGGQSYEAFVAARFPEAKRGAAPDPPKPPDSEKPAVAADPAPPVPESSPKESPPPSSGGCRVDDTSPSSALWLGLALLGLRRRRR